MQVSNTNIRVNFTSTPLHHVNLRKVANGVDEGFVKAVFTELGPCDKNALVQVKNGWGKGLGLVLAIWESFNGKQRKFCQFNAIELDEKSGGKIIGLVKSSFEKNNGKKELYLSAIVTKPEFRHKQSAREIKGIGENLLCCIFKIAKKMQAESLSFFSDDNVFYDKTFRNALIKVVPGENFNPEINHFEIKSSDFDKYIKYCDNKYKN